MRGQLILRDRLNDLASRKYLLYLGLLFFDKVILTPLVTVYKFTHFYLTYFLVCLASPCIFISHSISAVFKQSSRVQAHLVNIFSRDRFEWSNLNMVVDRCMDERLNEQENIRLFRFALHKVYNKFGNPSLFNGLFCYMCEKGFLDGIEIVLNEYPNQIDNQIHGFILILVLELLILNYLGF